MDAKPLVLLRPKLRPRAESPARADMPATEFGTSDACALRMLAFHFLAVWNSSCASSGERQSGVQNAKDKGAKKCFRRG
jgi:hypothetical protein